MTHTSCPPHTALVFGGMRSDGTDRGHQPLVIPFRLGAESTTAWDVAGHTLYTALGYLTAIAYCRSTFREPRQAPRPTPNR